MRTAPLRLRWGVLPRCLKGRSGCRRERQLYGASPTLGIVGVASPRCLRTRRRSRRRAPAGRPQGARAATPEGVQQHRVDVGDLAGHPGLQQLDGQRDHRSGEDRTGQGHQRRNVQPAGRQGQQHAQRGQQQHRSAQMLQDVPRRAARQIGLDRRQRSRFAARHPRHRPAGAASASRRSQMRDEEEKSGRRGCGRRRCRRGHDAAHSPGRRERRARFRPIAPVLAASACAPPPSAPRAHSGLAARLRLSDSASATTGPPSPAFSAMSGLASTSAEQS